MLATLRQRNFSLLWGAGLISLTGDWILQIALPVYVYQLTGSVLSTGLMFVANTLPGTLFASLAGVFVDRWDRRRILFIVSGLQGLLLLVLLAVRSADGLWVVYLVAFAEALLALFFGPAENALLPQLVGSEHLAPANALNGINNNLALLIGPALGGLLFGWLGLPGVVVLDSASFLIAAALIGLMRVPAQPRVRPGPPASAAAGWTAFWQEWRAGLRLVTANRALLAIFVAAGVAVVGEGLFTVLLIPFVALLQGGAVVLGWLLTIRGLGGLTGGLVIGWGSGRVRPQRLFPLSLGLIGLLALIMYNSAALGWVLVLLFLTGLPAMAAQVSAQTLFQSQVSDHLRGRVFGAFGGTVALLMLLGQGLASLLGDRLGPVALLNVGGALYLLAGGVALIMLSVPARRNLAPESPHVP